MKLVLCIALLAYMSIVEAGPHKPIIKMKEPVCLQCEKAVGESKGKEIEDKMAECSGSLDECLVDIYDSVSRDFPICNPCLCGTLKPVFTRDFPNSAIARKFLKRVCDPCKDVSCGKGSCRVEQHKPVCYCQPGYHSGNGKECTDIDECSKQGACHPTALCQNKPGSHLCTCPEGHIGDPFKSGCKPRGECVTDLDCPTASTCQEGRCIDPCVGRCGRGATCSVVDHSPFCSCPARTQGDPRVECKTLQCIENTDCDSGKSCVKNQCVDVCRLDGVCGSNAKCTTINHTPLCSCDAGYTGDPTVGCTKIQQCAVQNDCPNNMICAFGVCSPPCKSVRDCLTSQVCVNEKCVPKCNKNNDCPSFHECRGGVCAPAEKCRRNQDCADTEACKINALSFGQRECMNVCEGPVICGRNAVCRPSQHRPFCTCPEGYFGNPLDEKIGCVKKDCANNQDCPGDSVCQEYRCVAALECCEDDLNPIPSTCEQEGAPSCSVFAQNGYCDFSWADFKYTCSNATIGKVKDNCRDSCNFCNADPCNPDPCNQNGATGEVYATGICNCGATACAANEICNAGVCEPLPDCDECGEDFTGCSVIMDHSNYGYGLIKHCDNYGKLSNPTSCKQYPLQNKNTYVKWCSSDAIDCEWADWKFGKCSQTCGSKGTRTDTRIKLVVEENGGTCSGRPTRVERCNVKRCPGKNPDNKPKPTKKPRFPKHETKPRKTNPK